MNAEIALITSNDDILLLAKAAAERYEYLMGKVSKMPKMKALALIDQSYIGYESTDDYTVKDNLKFAYGQYMNNLNTRQAEILAEAQPKAEKPVKETKSIEALLADLSAATDPKTKKNIRAALRRQGHYVGSEANKAK